jgi:D-aspartate ligase
MSACQDAGSACVIGSMDLVRPLALAGIRCAVVVPRGDVAAYSRFTCCVVPWADPARQADVLLERLLTFARRQAEPPVLFYGTDADVLFVSRHREALRDAFRFVIADGALVESLVDKGRFRELAERLGLPVPASRRVESSSAPAEAVDLVFPVIVKPVARGRGDWGGVAHGAKAIAASSAEELRSLWPKLAERRLEVMVQELVPGPETRIESYHAYVDEAGTVVGEFTGRKVRTDPPAYGETTALEITAAPEVRELGRDIAQRLGLRGVAKMDFKRDDAGRLSLLEVNPRFNLWHHPGARAGVNLPALVHADLSGGRRPASCRARPGVRWVYHVNDARAARRHGVPLRRWLRWAAAAEAKSVVAADDPLPAVMGALLRAGGRVGIGPRAVKG